MQDLGIQLPAAPTPFGTYVETVQTGIQKTSVRVVIGVASLPLGVPIGLDVIFEVE